MLKIIFLFTLGLNAFAGEILPISFDLADLPTSKSNKKDYNVRDPNEEAQKKAHVIRESLDDMAESIHDSRFFKRYARTENDANDRYRLDDIIYIVPEDSPEEYVSANEPTQTMGMTQRQSLRASRDDISQNSCDHIQGNMANRWCHSAIARSFTSFLKKVGASEGLMALAGGVFWAPKEFFYDLNPSSSDFVFSYRDSLGTKRTTFEVTVFGDTFFKKYFGRDFAPFKSSTPFISIRRKL